MTTVQTEIDIAAPPERVWHVLTCDMPKKPGPYGISRFEGTMAPGARIKLWADIAPNRAFALRVAEFNAPRRMVWTGGMPFGLFTGTRTFTITETPDGAHFDMREVFSGLLSGMITKSMPDLTPSFITFATTLKESAEKS